MRFQFVCALVVVLSSAVAAIADDKPSVTPSRKPGNGPGFGRGGRFMPDMRVIHAMFDNRDKIRRTVKMLPDGAEALTESDVATLAALLQEHVPAMDDRVTENDPLPPMTFHPVFVGLINNSKKYTLEYETTEKGIKATYRAEDPFTILLVQEHAKLVSRFLKNGMAEIHKPYQLPEVNPGNQPAPENKKE